MIGGKKSLTQQVTELGQNNFNIIANVCIQRNMSVSLWPRGTQPISVPYPDPKLNIAWWEFFLDCVIGNSFSLCVCVRACVSINVIMVNLNDIPIIVWCTIYNYVSYMQWTWVFWLFFITLDFLICFVILVCELIFCGNLTSWVSQGILVFL